MGIIDGENKEKLERKQIFDPSVPKFNRLKMEYTDSFGYNTVVETDVADVTFNSLMDSVRQCLGAFGYSQRTIDEYFRD